MAEPLLPLSDDQIARAQRLARRRIKLAAQAAATRSETIAWVAEASAAGTGLRAMSRLLKVSPQTVYGMLDALVTENQPEAEAATAKDGLSEPASPPCTPPPPEPSDDEGDQAGRASDLDEQLPLWSA